MASKSTETVEAPKAVEQPAPMKPMTPVEAANMKPVTEFPSNIPKAPEPEPHTTRYDGQPPPDSAYKGLYFCEADGEQYALATVSKSVAVDGKTHFAKNSRHFWEGTRAQFIAQFEKL